MAIADVDQVAVWFFDPHHRTLTLAASLGVAADAEEALRNSDITPQTSSRWELMVRERRPRWITQDIDDSFLVAMLELVGVVTAVAVPITAHGEFYGVLVPGVTSDPTRIREDEDIVERLTGVSRYSATALRNARLVEEVTRQALRAAQRAAPPRASGLPPTRVTEPPTTSS